LPTKQKMEGKKSQNPFIDIFSSVDLAYTWPTRNRSEYIGLALDSIPCMDQTTERHLSPALCVSVILSQMSGFEFC